MSKAIVAFDYSALDKDTKSKLVCLAGQVKRHGKAFIDSGIEIGAAIHEAHLLLAGDGRDGKFKHWVALETGLSSTTAYDWMHAFRRAKKFPVIGNFPPTVACILSAPTVSDGALKEAEKAVDRGEKMTVSRAKELADRFREVSAKPKRKPKAAKPAKAPSTEAPTADESPAKEPQISGGVTFNTEEMQSECKDAFGNEVAGDLSKVFELCEGFDAQRSKLASIKTWMTQNENHPGAVVMAAAASRIRTDLKQADSELKFARPHCVCVYCKNKSPKVANCNACKGLGWITETIFEQAPKALKA